MTPRSRNRRSRTSSSECVCQSGSEQRRARLLDSDRLGEPWQLALPGRLNGSDRLGRRTLAVAVFLRVVVFTGRCGSFLPFCLFYLSSRLGPPSDGCRDARGEPHENKPGALDFSTTNWARFRAAGGRGRTRRHDTFGVLLTSVNSNMLQLPDLVLLDHPDDRLDRLFPSLLPLRQMRSVHPTGLGRVIRS